MQKDTSGRAAASAMALAVVAMLLPLAGTAAANHPANSCIDVEPETDSNPTGTSHQLTATLRTLQDGNCTGAVVTAGGGGIRVRFDIDGANDPNDPSAVESDLSCRINPNRSACTAAYTGTVAGTDSIFGWLDHDDDGVFDTGEPNDTVSKTWTEGAAARLDCNPETASNPATGTGSDEVYTCTVTDSAGNAIGGVRIDVEQAGANDPDNRGFTTAGNTTTDRNDACTTGSNGTCTITITGGVAGTGTICFWGDTDADNVFDVNGGQEDGGDCDSESQGSQDQDLTDVVTKTWTTEVAARLDCAPETAANTAGTTHTVTCTATTTAGALAGGVRVDAEITGVNDKDGNSTLTSPDIDNCTTNAQGVCTFQHGPTATSNAANARVSTASIGTTTYQAWIDADGNNATVEADTTEGQVETSVPGGVAEPDATDVVTKSWSGPPTQLTMIPSSDSASVGTCNAFTITARGANNLPVAGATIDVEQRHSLAANNISGDEPRLTFCTPEAAAGPNPSDVDVNRGDLRESPDNVGTAGGETARSTDGSGQITIGIRSEPAGTSNGSGTVTVIAFFETTDNDDPDTGEPQDTSTKTWVATDGRTINCEPETATNQVGTTHTVTCTVLDRFGGPVAGEGVTFSESGPGDITSPTQTTTNANGVATATVTSGADGTQTITGTLTDALTGEPDTDECDRVAGDPAGATAGICSDSVTKDWQGAIPVPGPCEGVAPGERASRAGGGQIIVGTLGNDEILGTEGADVICALGGDDGVDAAGGDDLVLLGRGDDVAAGRGGNDTIVGGAGNDGIVGNDGRDLLVGRSGADTIVGGRRNDVIRGGTGRDAMQGGGGWDTVRGGADDDLLRGWRGDDILRGGRGDDVLLGGPGDDILNGGAGIDECRGGPGSNIFRRCER